MASGDSKKMLNHCIYNYMKEKGLHVAADVFAVEANLDLGELLDSDKDMLKDWWRLFWPQFSSRLANKARGNSRPSVQQPTFSSYYSVSNASYRGIYTLK
ncbi:uncharacterized protein LOC108204645 isoform X3 [Daucus carota subsp. sativus]|uniref:uncharacterized protein LOC108204645 isoform X3 n=1 Tax=Daucus carota subsp. sativus TaxID=79200 RepID=UPI00308279E5